MCFALFHMVLLPILLQVILIDAKKINKDAIIVYIIRNKNFINFDINSTVIMSNVK